MAQFKSPTGSLINGTLETVTARCRITGIDPTTGQVLDYTGNTEVFWDEMKPVTRGGKMVFLDEDGDEWTFDRLSPIEEDDDADRA